MPQLTPEFKEATPEDLNYRDTTNDPRCNGCGNRMGIFKYCPAGHAGSECISDAPKARCKRCGFIMGTFKECGSAPIKGSPCIPEANAEPEKPRVNLEGIQTITEFVSAAYLDACDRGWHDKPRAIPEVTNLFHEEAAEMFREYRDGRGAREIYFQGDKPCGFPTELADLVIRAFDAAGEFGIDLQAAIVAKMKYNRTRAHRHGGKVC